jgi:RsiW-degrading membrane proteinase PrsW (M82 family)
LPKEVDIAGQNSKPGYEKMSDSVKKLIGTVGIVTLVIVYALVATAIATARLADSPWWVHALYFLFTGLLWVVPAMFIIKWMATPSNRG